MKNPILAKVLVTAYGESEKNQGIAKITLQTEKPLYQNYVTDWPEAECQVFEIVKIKEVNHDKSGGMIINPEEIITKRYLITKSCLYSIKYSKISCEAEVVKDEYPSYDKLNESY